MCINLYSALGVPVNSTLVQIRKSFLNKARQICPDRQINHPEWQAMNEYFAYVIFAYEILKNPETREAYDSNGFKGLQSKGVVIPAGFANFKNPIMDLHDETEHKKEKMPKTSKIPENPSRSTSTSTTTTKDKDTMTKAEGGSKKRDSQQRRQHWAKQTEDKMRVKHEHECNEAVIRIAVYRKIVKIAWKKEILNERRSTPFSYSKTRE